MRIYVRFGVNTRISRCLAQLLANLLNRFTYMAKE